MIGLLLVFVFNYNNVITQYQEINSNIIYEQALKDSIWNLVENFYNDSKTGDFTNYEKNLVEIQEIEQILNTKTKTNKNTYAAFLGVKNSLKVVIDDISLARIAWNENGGVATSSTFFQEAEKNFGYVKTNITELILIETENIAEISKEIEATQTLLTVTMTVFALIIIVFSLIFSVYFANTITKPITSLSKTAEGIAAGNLALDVDKNLLNIKDETGSLAKSFNAMIIKLRNDRNQLEQFKFALDGTSEHIILTDIDGKVTYANKAVEKLTGYTHEEVIGQNPRLWGGKMSDEFYTKMWKTIKEDRQPFEGEVRNQRKNKEEYFAHITISPILKDTNKLTGFVGIEQDVTESKKYEQRLEETVKKSTSELRASIDALINAYILIDTNGKISLTNTNLTTLLGKPSKEWTLEELQAKLSPAFDFTSNWQTVVTHQKNNLSQDVVWRGKILEIRMNPVFSLEVKKQLLGVLVLLSDVTEERHLSRSRDEFFSIASHELRTPLTAIRGNTSLIQEMYLSKISDPDFAEMVQDIHESSVRLIGIVNDFLNVSRLEIGKLDFALASVDIMALSKDVIEEFKNEAKIKDIKLILKESNTKLPKVLADQDRLKEILINLVGNAIKYTDKGSVTLEYIIDGKKIKGLITDTGRGISAQNQELLFKKFQQASDSIFTRDTSKGTGLGLYITKLMVEGMAGTVALEATKEGKGSTFSFSLPISK